MRFLHGAVPPHELTYNDVFLVPERSDVDSRLDVDLSSPDGTGTHLPIVVANMTAVAGKRMAETIARRGGIAVLPQDSPTDVIGGVIAAVKAAHPVYDTPITLGPHSTLAHAMSLVTKRSHGAVVVVDDHRHPIGVVSERDAVDHDQFTQLHEVMSRAVITVRAGTPLPEIYELVSGERLTMVPVVDDADRLVGVITRKGSLRSWLYQPALDSHGRLMVGAALGINGDVVARAEALIGAGADLLVVDTAHGHQDKTIRAIKAVRDVAGDLPLVAGNVVTAHGTVDLITAGADIVKVGVGPGAMCTTRMMTGVGRPQFSAVLETAAAARDLGKHIWADGGIRHPRDVALALAGGAASVMIGSWFAATYESAGDVQRDANGRLYKENYGMASHRAVRGRTRGQAGFERALKELFDEGISSSRLYLDPEHPGVEDLLDGIVAGVRSSCTYSGARTVEELHRRAVVGIQGAAGFTEGQPMPGGW